MKQLRYTYLLLMAALIAACSSDNADEQGSTPAAPQTVRVGLRISPLGSTATRAWTDTYATDQEMMNLWTVVVVNDADNKVQAIHACKPIGDPRREIDDYVELPTGTYRFYSFANIAPSVVMQLLGIPGSGATGGTVTRSDGDADPTGGSSFTPYTKDNADNIASAGEDNTVYDISFASDAEVVAADAAALTTNVAGNGFTAFTSSDDNGFGSYGIPMSNVQTKTITASTTFDLIVVRMMAKVELQIKNSTGAAVTINRATLSNVTQNRNANLRLLPSLTKPDDMAATHQDIRPNLGTPVQDNYTYTFQTSERSIANDATQTVTFYVNESATPTNADGLFFLTLEFDKGSDPAEFRYALISNTAGDEWSYIARNDYRIIPIRLDDLKFEVVPYDFPPIGVYPCSVKEVDATNHVYEFTFHDYGHFHLLPSVTKAGSPINFTADTPTSGSDYSWGLVGNAWASSFFTYTTFGAATQTENPGDFYRVQVDENDGDEAGGIPVWYANTPGRPQWDPTASGNYQPFIFGYIAEAAGEKRVYHEMRIQVYNGTSAYRQMLYRFYMVLDTEQLLSAPARLTAPRHPHHHVTTK